MKRSLMTDIRKIQLRTVLIFALSAFVLTSVFIWFNTIRVYRMNLLSVTRFVATNISVTPSLYSGTDRPSFQKHLRPLLEQVIDSSSNNLTIGFYSRYSDQVVIAASQDKDVNLEGVIIPSNHTGRLAWRKKAPVFSFSSFYARPVIVYKCDNPVSINGKVIGHVFANMTLSSLIWNIVKMGSVLLLLFFTAGLLALWASNGTAKTIRRNLDGLLLRDRSGLFSTFDYGELAEISKTNYQTHKRIEAILESTTDAYLSIDRNWRLVWANDRAVQFFEREWEDIAGENIWSIFSPDYQLAFGQHLNEVMLENKPRHFESFIASANHCLEVHVYPVENGLSVYFRDITQQKLYENRIAAERERLLVILRFIGSGVIATDENGAIILMNETAETLTGYQSREAVGQLLEENFYVMDNKSSEPYNSQIRNVLTVGTAFSVEKAVLVTYDLKEVFISLSCAPIIEPEGKPIGMVIVFNDITEKLKLQEELIRTEKLESVGILAGGIAHDFNNILAAILSNLQLIQLKLEHGEDVRGYLIDTVETTHKASDLTKQLLTFSQGGAPVKKAASLTDLIRDTADFALRGSSVKLQTVLAQDLWPAEVDTGQISQVIHNLVLNAKQAMPKGGSVQVNAENFTAKPGTKFKAGNYVRITVHDQGTGIPPEILRKIFDPFFTTKQGGTGLGLATSYSIIRQHDGYLEVDSQVGVGTAFFIYLPATLAETFSLDDKGETAASSEGARILLMDDEDSILQVVNEMLQYFGYRVTPCKNGSEAIDHYIQALASGDPYDAVIMDLTVPGGMGGQEAISVLRDIDPHVKAVVTSGYINDLVIAEYERFGFRGVVAKPYKFNELHSVLDKVIGDQY